MIRAARFRQARQRSEISITEMAAKLGVSRTSVVNWDNGTSFPRRDMAEKIARVLQIDPESLAKPVDDPSPPEDILQPTDVAQILGGAKEQIAEALGLPLHRVSLALTIVS